MKHSSYFALFLRRVIAGVCAAALSLPAFAADTSALIAENSAALPAPKIATNSITYAQYLQHGGNSAIMPLPAGEFEIKRDKAYIAPGAILGGILSSSLGTFVVAGAIVAGGVAIGKEVKEQAFSSDEPPADDNTGGGCPDETPLTDPLDGNNCIAEYEAQHCPAQNMIPNAAKNGCTGCPTGTVEDSAEELTCRALAAADCGTMVFANGSCRPANADDCGGNSNNEIPAVAGGVVSCTACPSNLPMENANGLMCEPISCNAPQVPAANGESCIDAFMAADCPAQGMVPNAAQNGCEVCPAGMVEDTAEEEMCRALAAADCGGNSDNEIPQAVNGVLQCMACDSATPFENTDGLSCRAEAAGDCAAGDVFDSGMCRAATADDCGGNTDNEIPQAMDGLANCTACATLDSATPLETTDGLSCRAEAAGDCAAGEVFDGGMCRAANGDDCGGNSDNEIPQAMDGLANCTACATIDSATPFESADGLFCQTRLASCNGGNENSGSRVFTPLAAGTVIEGGAHDGRGTPHPNTLLNGKEFTFDNDTFREFADKLLGSVNSAFNGYSRLFLRQDNAWRVGEIASNNVPDFSVGSEPDRFLMAGDVVAITRFGTTTSRFNITLVAAIFRVYEGTGGSLRIAMGEKTAARIAGATLTEDAASACELTGDQFFLDDDWAATTDFADSRRNDDFGPAFRQILGGELNEHNSVQVNNFSFTADSTLKNMRMEYALPETKTGEVSWRAYSGYRRENAGKTQIYYQKSVAEYAPEDANWKLYAISQSGRINSEIYESTALQGFAAGFFADRIFRHDDSYHIRMHSAFSAAEVREWQLSATARIGKVKENMRLGLDYNMEREATTARLLYRRRF